MAHVTTLLAKAGHIYRTEGWGSLLRATFLFTLHLFYVSWVHQVYASVLEEDQSLRNNNLAPPLDDVTHMFLSTNEQVDDVEARGYEFRSVVRDSRAMLNAGATAACVFVGKELGNVVWVATTQQAMDSLKEAPFTVDFAGGECWTGRAWTNPKYRGSGLFSYADIKSRRRQLEQGIRVSKWALGEQNMPSKSIAARIGATVCGEGRYRRILWWSSWKERALGEGGQCRGQAL